MPPSRMFYMRSLVGWWNAPGDKAIAGTAAIAAQGWRAAGHQFRQPGREGSARLGGLSQQPLQQARQLLRRHVVGMWLQPHLQTKSCHL